MSILSFYRQLRILNIKQNNHPANNFFFFFSFLFFCLRGAMGCSQKSFMLVWKYHKLLIGFLAKDHLQPNFCWKVSNLKMEFFITPVKQQQDGGYFKVINTYSYTIGNTKRGIKKLLTINSCGLHEDNRHI